MYKATIDQHVFKMEKSDHQWLANGVPIAWELVEVTSGYFHIIHNQKSYTAEIVKVDPATKTYTIKLNGRLYSVGLKDKVDLLLEKMGMANAAGNKVNHLKAPMPGLIIDLKVKAGDTVKPGDALLILEAMKMENVLKSPGEGTVKSVKIKKGDSVEKGQVLLEF